MSEKTEEMEAMNKAVADADAAYFSARQVQSDFDEAHTAARRKLQELRGGVFGKIPGSMNIMHTNQVLHDWLRAVQEEAN